MDSGIVCEPALHKFTAWIISLLSTCCWCFNINRTGIAIVPIANLLSQITYMAGEELSNKMEHKHWNRTWDLWEISCQHIKLSGRSCSLTKRRAFSLCAKFVHCARSDFCQRFVVAAWGPAARFLGLSKTQRILSSSISGHQGRRFLLLVFSIFLFLLGSRLAASFARIARKVARNRIFVLFALIERLLSLTDFYNRNLIYSRRERKFASCNAPCVRVLRCVLLYLGLNLDTALHRAYFSSPCNFLISSACTCRALSQPDGASYYRHKKQESMNFPVTFIIIVLTIIYV